jgi:hypothetical protein
VIERVAANLGHVLREEHLRPAVAVEIAEAHVAPRAKPRRVEFPPPLRLWVLRPQPGEIAIAPLHSLLQIRGCRRRRRDAEGAKTRGRVRRHAGDALRQLAIAHVDELMAVHGGAEPVAFDGGLEPIPGLRVVRERHARQLPPGSDAELPIEWQPDHQPQPRAALERQPIVVARGTITQHQARIFVQGQGPHRQVDTVIAPLRIPGHEERRDALRFEVDGVLLQVGTVGFVSCDPRIEVHDRVAPRIRGHPTMLEVVVFLNGAVQQTDRRRQHPWRKTREVVFEQLHFLSGTRALDRSRRQESHHDGE